MFYSQLYSPCTILIVVLKPTQAFLGVDTPHTFNKSPPKRQEKSHSPSITHNLHSSHHLHRCGSHLKKKKEQEGEITHAFNIGKPKLKQLPLRPLSTDQAQKNDHSACRESHKKLSTLSHRVISRNLKISIFNKRTLEKSLK